MSSVADSREDLFLWPCGTWCSREESSGFNHLSDDYEVLTFGSERWKQFMLANDPIAGARVEGYGYLSGQCGAHRPLQVLRSAAGFYLGTLTEEGFPNTRESVRYWPSRAEAESALATGDWVQRMDL